MTSRSEDGGLADDDQLRVDLCSFQTLLFFLVSFVNPLERGLVLRTPWEGQIEEDRMQQLQLQYRTETCFSS